MQQILFFVSKMPENSCFIKNIHKLNLFSMSSVFFAYPKVIFLSEQFRKCKEISAPQKMTTANIALCCLDCENDF